MSTVQSRFVWSRKGRVLLPVLALAFAASASLSAQGRGGGGQAPGGGASRPAPAPSMSPSASPTSNVPQARTMDGSGASTWSRHPRQEPNGEFRPRNVPVPASRRVIQPRATAQCYEMPVPRYWKTRDLQAELMFNARRGFLAVHPVGEDVAEFQDNAWFPSGWKAYGFIVPGKEKLHVRLHHVNEGWFRLIMVDKWGQMTEGMLQNIIPTGNPEVTFNNPRKEAKAVYVIVDDPGWMSSKARPFTLNIDRSWDPAKTKLAPVPQVVGIWATLKPEAEAAKADPAKADAAKAAPAPVETPKG